jgi:predicted nucleotidyltransferase
MGPLNKRVRNNESSRSSKKRYLRYLLDIMARGNQIDRLSKKYVKLNQREKKFAKREHKRYLRRIRKCIIKLNPLHNRYNGFIG